MNRSLRATLSQAISRTAFEAAFIILCAVILQQSIGFSEARSQKSSGVRNLEKIAIPTNAIWIDARREEEYSAGHIPGAIRIDQHDGSGSFAQAIKKLENNEQMIVYCRRGCKDSHKVGRRFKDMGVPLVYVLTGGYELFSANDELKMEEVR